MRQIPTLITLVLAGMLVPACDDSPTAQDEPDYSEFIAQVRDATRSFADIDVALAAGYEQASPCVEEMEGAMGYHYARFPLIDATVDATRPELLLYIPTADGGMRLVGVEYMVMAETWDAENSGPPTLQGVEFADHRPEDLRHGIPFPHYDLHAWVWEENDSGLFAPYNPALSC
jgi:hypothetical protein